jgi:hypothetical protein
MASAIILPISSLALLHYRLQAFGNLSSLQVALLVGAACGVFLFGFFALRNILMVRMYLNRAHHDDAERSS